MLEFEDIFANGLATTVYVYGSILFLLACTSAALWLSRQPRAAGLDWKYSAAPDWPAASRPSPDLKR